MHTAMARLSAIVWVLYLGVTDYMLFSLPLKITPAIHWHKRTSSGFNFKVVRGPGSWVVRSLALRTSDHVHKTIVKKEPPLRSE